MQISLATSAKRAKGLSRMTEFRAKGAKIKQAAAAGRNTFVKLFTKFLAPGLHLSKR